MTNAIDTVKLKNSLSEHIYDDELNLDEIVNKNVSFNDNGTLIIVKFNGFVLEFDSESYNFIGGFGGVSPNNDDIEEC